MCLFGLKTKAGIILLSENSEGMVKVDMGLPDIRKAINRSGGGCVGKAG